jgi:hypothetical protein
MKATLCFVSLALFNRLETQQILINYGPTTGLLKIPTEKGVEEKIHHLNNNDKNLYDEEVLSETLITQSLHLSKEHSEHFDFIQIYDLSKLSAILTRYEDSQDILLLIVYLGVIPRCLTATSPSVLSDIFVLQKQSYERYGTSSHWHTFLYYQFHKNHVRVAPLPIPNLSRGSETLDTILGAIHARDLKDELLFKLGLAPKYGA